MEFDFVSYAMGKAAGGGGDGKASVIETWDLTSSFMGKYGRADITPLGGATISPDGVVFDISDPTSGVCLLCPMVAYNMVIEVDFGNMNLGSGAHRRCLMVNEFSGLIYRATGVWGFYNGTAWATDSQITDGGFFSNSKLRIEIDKENYWHIYKDETIVYEPNSVLSVLDAKQFLVGSVALSMDNTTVKGVTVIAGGV